MVQFGCTQREEVRCQGKVQVMSLRYYYILLLFLALYKEGYIPLACVVVQKQNTQITVTVSQGGNIECH